MEQMELFIFHRIAAYTCRWNSIHRGCVMSQSTSDILFDELNARCHATITSATVLRYTVKYNCDTKDFVASVLINVLTRCLIAIDCPTWLTTRYKVSKSVETDGSCSLCQFRVPSCSFSRKPIISFLERLDFLFEYDEL